MKAIRIAIAALLVLAAAALVGIGRPEAASGASDTPQEGITVTGTGQVSSVPNEAEFSLGVSTTGTTARSALASNSEQMQRVIDALRAAGVARADIKTQDVSVGRDYDDDGGYAARNSVSVTIHDLDRAGAVLDATSRAGANEVYGPSLTRANRSGLEAKALKVAYADAHDRAEALAEAAGVSLGKVTAITEEPQSGGEYMPMLAERDSAAPIEAGRDVIAASVTVTFAIS
ncbi:MAG TPA: SIMPL domain-containing protein [Gaiellaceae bacterium]|nr:SIMPL domain-containing protein [Gaiellaceae bacterium]